MKIICIVIWITKNRRKRTTFIIFIIVEGRSFNSYKQLSPSNGFPHSPYSWNELSFFLEGLGDQHKYREKWRV